MDDRTVYERMFIYEHLVDLALEVLGSLSRIAGRGSSSRQMRLEELRCSRVSRELVRVGRHGREVRALLGEESTEGVLLMERIERLELVLAGVGSVVDHQTDWKAGLACFRKYAPELGIGKGGNGMERVIVEESERGSGNDSQEELDVDEYVAVERF